MPHQPTPPLFNTVPSPQEIDIAKKTVHVLIDKRDAFAKLKDEALAKRDAAKGADAIEAAKRELDSANRQFEQAKRQLDDAKRQLEQLQRQNEAPTHGEQFTYTTKPRPPVAVESPTGAAAQPATPEEIKILHERVNTIEDQLKFAQERLKAGKGATTLDVIQVGCDLALAQSDVALAEGRLDEAIAKLQQAQKQAEDAVKIASTAARAGVGGDYEAILKAKRNLSDIKLKLIPLQSPPYIAPQAIPNTTIEPTRPPQPPRVKSAMPSAKIPDWARPTTALAPAQPAPPAKEFGRPAPTPIPPTPHVPNFDVETTARRGPDGQTVYEQHAIPPAVTSNSPAASYEAQEKTSPPTALFAAETSPRPGEYIPGRPSPILRIYIFYSPDSRPALIAKSSIEKIVKQLTHVELVEIDVSREPNKAKNLAIDKVPTCLLVRVRDGEVVRRIVGLQDAEELQKQINDALSMESTKASEARGAAGPALSKSALRYDGKTFDQWRTAWRTELSTEKRLEAVKALAAFGANGYGKEAAEAILDVAAQYDWTSIGADEGSDALQVACIRAFGGDWPFSGGPVPQKIPPADVLPWATKVVQSGTRQQKLFLTYVLANIEGDSIDLRVKLSRDKDAAIREYALGSLPSLVKVPANEQLSSRVRDSILSKDPDEAMAAISKTFQPKRPPESGATFVYVPEITSALFSSHEQVRKYARNAIQFAKDDHATTLLKELSAVLDDPKRKDQRIEAIRALATLGKNAKPATEKLLQLAKSDNQSISIAAVNALSRILDNSAYNNMLVEDFGDRLGIKLQQSPSGEEDIRPSDPRKAREYIAFQHALTVERKELFP